MDGMGSPWQQHCKQHCRSAARLACSSSKGLKVVEYKHNPTGLGQEVEQPPPPQLSMLGKGQSWVYGCSQYWF